MNSIMYCTSLESQCLYCWVHKSKCYDR